MDNLARSDCYFKRRRALIPSLVTLVTFFWQFAKARFAAGDRAFTADRLLLLKNVARGVSLESP